MCLLALSHAEIFTTHRDGHLIFAATCYLQKQWLISKKYMFNFNLSN